MRKLLLATSILALSACGERARPDPTEPAGEVRLSLEMVAPGPGSTVVAGRHLEVRIAARDPGGARVEGIGFVVRNGGVVLDSMVIRFDARTYAVHAFRYTVPAGLPADARLELSGSAFGRAALPRATVARSIVVARCEPFQTCGG